MKKTFKFLIGLTLSLVSFISCNNVSFGDYDYSGSGGTPSSQASKIIEVHHNAINRLGNTKFILDEQNNARFYDGQIMNKPFFGYYNNIVFKSSLVEYSNFNIDVENYVKQQEDNCMLNHHYDVQYDKNKDYVEFSSFIDTENNEIVMCQVRIIPGNWEDIYNKKRADDDKDCWYGKSVMFSPDYTIDIHRNLNILTKEHETYKYEYAKYEDGFTVKTPAKIYTSLINYDGPNGNKELIQNLGTFNKMFANEVKDVSSNGRWMNNQIIQDDGKVLSFEGNIVEYTSLNPKLIEHLKNVKVDSIAHSNQHYPLFEYDNTKKYIEVGCFYYPDTNEVYRWELFIPEGNFYGDNSKVKVLYLRPNQL